MFRKHDEPSRVAANKLLPFPGIEKHSTSTKPRIEPVNIVIRKKRSTSGRSGKDAMPAIKRKMELCNALYHLPDGEDETGNYSYHSTKLARVIVQYTKSFWPEKLPNVCVRFAQLDEGKDKLSIRAIFWESEKHCEAGEKTRFSFTVKVTSQGLQLTNFGEGKIYKKAVLKSTAAAIAARNEDAKRRSAQLAGRGLTLKEKIERGLAPCLFPARTDSMCIEQLCDATEVGTDPALVLPMGKMTIGTTPLTFGTPLGTPLLA